MKKILSAIMAAVILMSALLVSGDFSALAVSQTDMLFSIDQPQNMAISILYDAEEPIISFIAPNGAAYGAAQIQSGAMRVERGDKWVSYYIPNAMAGDWSIVYDKLSNSSLEVSYSSYLNSITITGLTQTNINDSYLSVEFMATSSDEGSYNYEVYAVADDGAASGARLLSRGTGTLNQAMTTDISIRDLLDYDGYHLRLDVSKMYDSREVFDSLVSDWSFAVSSSGLPPIGGIRAKINLTDGELALDWSEYSRYCDSYFVAVFDIADLKKPLYFSELESGYTDTELVFPLDAAGLRVELYYRSGGNNSQLFFKNISLDTGVSIDIESAEAVNSTQAKINYRTRQSVLAEVIVNGHSEQVNLTGSGFFSLGLDPDLNEIEIRYSLGDPETVYSVSGEIIVDNIAPMLRLPENGAPLHMLDPQYILAGITEPGCTVTGNGLEAAVGPEGAFIYTVDLIEGENVVAVMAVDMAGNSTAQDVIIYLQKDSIIAGAAADQPVDYLPLIISVVVSLALVALIWIAGRGYGKSDSKPTYILNVIRIAFAALTVLAILGEGFFVWQYFRLKDAINSELFYETVQQGVGRAYELIESYERAEFWMLALAAAIVISAAAAVGITLIMRARKKKADGVVPGVAGPVMPPPIMPPAAPPIIPSVVPPDNTVGQGEAGTGPVICPNCGAEHGGAARFCAKCGTQLPPTDRGIN